MVWSVKTYRVLSLFIGNFEESVKDNPLHSYEILVRIGRRNAGLLFGGVHNI